MRSTPTKAILAAAVAAPTLLLAAPTTAQAAPTASATILATPNTVTRSADLTNISVTVTYKCKNTSQVRYYLTGEVTQYDAPDTYYSVGLKGETGVVTATCTGGKVTQTFKFLRNWYGSQPGVAQLQPGVANFVFRLDARAATGPGWYQDMNPDSVVTKQVALP